MKIYKIIKIMSAIPDVTLVYQTVMAILIYCEKDKQEISNTYFQLFYNINSDL